MNTKSYAILGAVLIVLVSVASLMFSPILYKAPSSTSTSVSTTSTSSTRASLSSFAVALTDPPSVPAGTSALFLNYSRVELITNSSPYFANVSGSVNLLLLVNVSKIIATFSLPKNVSVNQIRLFVSSVTIEINGSKYSVFVPSSVLKIPVANVSLVNGTIGALVDLRPHVVTTFVGQSQRFILTPEAFAMPFTAKEMNVSYKIKVGQVFVIPKHFSKELKREFMREIANLSVESVSLYSKGNETVFRISLKNMGKEPVTVYAISVQTTWNATFRSALNFSLNEFPNYFSMKWNLEKSVNVSFPVLFFVNGTKLVAFPTPRHVIPFVSNFTPLNAWNGNDFRNSFNFTPSNGNVFRNAFNSCVIYPGERVTFEYEGVLVLGQGKNFSLILTVPPNEVFSFRVLSMPPYYGNYSFATFFISPNVFAQFLGNYYFPHSKSHSHCLKKAWLFNISLPIAPVGKHHKKSFEIVIGTIGVYDGVTYLNISIPLHVIKLDNQTFVARNQTIFPLNVSLANEFWNFSVLGVIENKSIASYVLNKTGSCITIFPSSGNSTFVYAVKDVGALNLQPQSAREIIYVPVNLHKFIKVPLFSNISNILFEMF